jgi:hypothetical protein
MIKSRFVVPHFIAAASVLLCVVSSAKAQDKVLLRMNLHPGQSFDEGTVMEMQTSSKMPKMNMNVTMTMHSGFHKEVLDVDKDGNIKVKATFQKSTTDISGDVGGKPVPSQKKDASGLSSLADYTGQSIVETMTPQGKVIHVEGMDAIIQRQIAAIKDSKQRAMIQEMVKKNFDPSKMFFTGIGRFPEGAVAVGDSWTSLVSVPMLPQASMKYTLMSSKDGIATIAVRADFSPNAKTPAIKTSEFQMKADISGTESGVMRVDEKTGLTISSELHIQMKDVVSMNIPKSTSNKKPNPAIPSSITVYAKGVTRSWTVKLPQ